MDPMAKGRIYARHWARMSSPQTAWEMERLDHNHINGITPWPEIAGDVMFWPTGKHHFGWYLEPAYDYSFARGSSKVTRSKLWAPHCGSLSYLNCLKAPA